MKDIAYKAMQVNEKLSSQNDREPTITEIANELNISRESVVLSLESVMEPISLYDTVYSDGADTVFVMDQIGDKNDDINWLNEIALKESIRKLNDREKNILTLRFIQGKTQVEVANEIGISQAQVSRLEKSTLNKVKKGI